MNTHYTYLLLLGCCIAAPLALSFDKKVAFYSKWKCVWPAILWPAIFFVAADIWFVHLNVWRFNAQYVLPGFSIAGLPVEEILFFIIVPYCCLFIYECVSSYFPQIQDGPLARMLLALLAIGLAIVAVVFRAKIYTFYCTLFLALALAAYLVFRKNIPGFKPALFLVSFALILVPFLCVNGVLTALPVVSYAVPHHLGIYIYTIPIEDVFYGMLLCLANILLYERSKSRIKI